MALLRFSTQASSLPRDIVGFGLAWVEKLAAHIIISKLRENYMEFALFVLAVIIVTITISIYSQLRHNKKLRNKIHITFGRVPDNDDINLQSASSYVKFMKQHDLRIDHITWNDLDKSFFRQENLIQFFDGNPNKRFEAQYVLVKFRKNNDNCVASLMFNADKRIMR